MIHSLKHTLIITIIFSGLFFFQNAFATCINKGNGIWETANNTHTAVNECIEAASADHTINIVAGSGSVTWPAGAVTVPGNKPLKITGPGRGNLTIILGGDYAFHIAPYIGTAQLPATRIRGLKFASPLVATANGTGTHTGVSNTTVLTDATKSWTTNALVDYYLYNTSDTGARCVITGNTSTSATCSALTGGARNIWRNGDTYEIRDGAKYTAIHAQGQGWRIDHCEYESIEAPVLTATSSFMLATGLNTTILPYGLVDNNTIINGKVATGVLGAFSKMSAVWLNPSSLGTGNSVYIEDNHFSSSKVERKMIVDTNYSGTYVFRYNTTAHNWTLVHGLQADDTRGPRHWELYGNTFEVNANMQGISVLAGTGVIFNNSMTATGYYPGLILFGHERSNRIIGAAGLCDGTSLWDGNLDTTGWPCRDQIGTGQDASLWSDQNILPAPTQALTPVYVWSNFSNESFLYPTITHNAPTHIHKNRDYYQHDTTNCPAGGSSCTAGVGCGTLADRPPTCTPGVAYWATNRSCTDMTGMVGANPTRPISGTLYKCTDTNMWEAYYTPYTYPHPLRAGDDTRVPAAPAGLTVN